MKSNEPNEHEQQSRDEADDGEAAVANPDAEVVRAMISHPLSDPAAGEGTTADNSTDDAAAAAAAAIVSSSGGGDGDDAASAVSAATSRSTSRSIASASVDTSPSHRRVETPEDRLAYKLRQQSSVAMSTVSRDSVDVDGDSRGGDTNGAEASEGVAASTRHMHIEKAVPLKSQGGYGTGVAAAAAASSDVGDDMSRARAETENSVVTRSSPMNSQKAASMGGASVVANEDTVETNSGISITALRRGQSACSSPGAYHVDPIGGGSFEEATAATAAASPGEVTSQTDAADVQADVQANGNNMADQTAAAAVAASATEYEVPIAFVVKDDDDDGGNSNNDDNESNMDATGVSPRTSDVEMAREDATVAVQTATAVKTHSFCGVHLPTSTWKCLVASVLALMTVAIILGALAGTGKIGGGDGGEGGESTSDKSVTSTANNGDERPTLLDCPATKILASDGMEEAHFARAVDISSGVAVVGAFRASDRVGAAYVYERVEKGGDWKETSKLVVDDGQYFDHFGVSVVIGMEGNLLAIGADGVDEKIGAVYVFMRTESNRDEADGAATVGGSGWRLISRISADDGRRGDGFGDTVAMDGTTLVVGAGIRNTGGVVYVYEIDQSGNGKEETFAFKLQAKLTSGAPSEVSDKFGGTTALAGNTLVVGSQKANEFDQVSGSAYVFVRNGTEWSQQAKLLPDTGGFGFEFGNYVDIDHSGNTIAVGSWKSTRERTEQEGSVYIFARSDNTWAQRQQIIPDEPVREKRRFGNSVSLSSDGNTILVGSYHHDGKSGAVYQFSRPSPEEDFVQVKKIVPPGIYPDDTFGSDVSIDKSKGANDEATALIGETGEASSTGAAWLVDLC